MNKALDYVSVKSEIGNYTNFITKPIALRLFISKDVRNTNFGKFLQSFFKRIEEQKIENVIIDLSYNTGGDERLGKQLIWYLTENEPLGFTEYINNSEYLKTQVKEDYKKYNALYNLKYFTDLPKGEVNITEKLFNEPYFENITKENSPFFLDKNIRKFKGKVFLIIGPQTFSAGQVLATTIADNNLATLIGKPLGNKPTTQTGGSVFKLPNTKKIISISYVFMERPDKTKNKEKSLFPDIELHNTFKDFLNGDNRVMEYILKEKKN
jgi:C-terminal processing protease CtpA/Prc